MILTVGSNAFGAIVVDSGIVTLISLSHFSNALFLISFTELGMDTEIRFLHIANARSSMVFTEFGMVIDSILVLANCHVSILVIEFDNVTVVR